MLSEKQNKIDPRDVVSKFKTGIIVKGGTFYAHGTYVLVYLECRFCRKRKNLIPIQKGFLCKSCHENRTRGYINDEQLLAYKEVEETHSMDPQTRSADH